MLRVDRGASTAEAEDNCAFMAAEQIINFLETVRATPPIAPWDCSERPRFPSESKAHFSRRLPLLGKACVFFSGRSWWAWGAKMCTQLSDLSWDPCVKQGTIKNSVNFPATSLERQSGSTTRLCVINENKARHARQSIAGRPRDSPQALLSGCLHQAMPTSWYGRAVVL